MNEDFMDEIAWFREKFGHEPQSEDEIVDRFAMHGPERRIGYLHRFESSLKGDGEMNLNDVRRASGRVAINRRLNDMHQALLKVGR